MMEKNNLELLQRLKKVETPDHLYTRIKTRIEDVSETIIQPKWAISIAASFAILIAINVFSFMNYSNNLSQDVSMESTEMSNYVGADQSNQLYHE